VAISNNRRRQTAAAAVTGSILCRDAASIALRFLVASTLGLIIVVLVGFIMAVQMMTFASDFSQHTLNLRAAPTGDHLRPAINGVDGRHVVHDPRYDRAGEQDRPFFQCLQANCSEMSAGLQCSCHTGVVAPFMGATEPLSQVIRSQA